LSVKRVYEAMFLFDSTTGSTWERVEEQVKRLMERAEADLIRMKKWDDRRLTYEVQGHKRGTYVLAFFKAPTDKIAGMERDVQLSEEILRVLIICRGHMTEEKLNEMVEKAQAYVPPAHHEGLDRGYGRDYGRDREGYDPRGYRGDRDSSMEENPGLPEEGGEEIPASSKE